MRVVVDRTLCESNAVCARLVPEVFVVDDDDRLHIKQEEPPAALRERVEHAVRRCPKLALSIVEDREGTHPLPSADGRARIQRAGRP